MIKRGLLVFLLFLFTFIQFGQVALAADEERKATERDESAYELMTYADNGWLDWKGQAGANVAKGVKDFLWMTNIVITKLVLMIVYQLFSLDIVEMTKDSIEHIVSGTAGALVMNLGFFALAVASVGIVLRAYVQQNWKAFFKLLILVIFSMSLLFSLQAKKFNYIDFAHDLSISLENTFMRVNPSLTGSEDFYFKDFNDNTARNLSISIENKVFDALLYKPYLLLQYGTTDEAAITADDPNRITRYLDADPRTEEGIEERERIAEEEYNPSRYNNKNIFAGNAWKQSGYILVMILSTIVQGVVFFSIALLRVMLQFGFILMMLVAPIMIFLSMFPTFESVVGRYLKGSFLIIMFKAMTIFIVLVAVSFVSLGYDLTNASNDIYYRIFTQIIFAIATIFMYAKRQFLLNMLEGATPSLEEMGGGRLPRPHMSRQRPLRGGTQRNVLPFNRGKVNQAGNGKKRSAHRNPVAAAKKRVSETMSNAREASKSKLRDAEEYATQKGEFPGMDNPYQSTLHAERETAAMRQRTVSQANIRSKQTEVVTESSGSGSQGKTGKMSSARNPRNFKRGTVSTAKQKVSSHRQPTRQPSKTKLDQKSGLSDKLRTAKGYTGSKLRSAKEYVSQVQRGEVPGMDNPYQSTVNRSKPSRLHETSTSSFRSKPVRRGDDA